MPSSHPRAVARAWSADLTAPCRPVSPHLGRPGGLPRSEPPPCGQALPCQSPPGGPGPLLAASPACPALSRVQPPATGGFNWRTGPPSLGRRRGVSRLTVLLPIADSPSMATSTLTPSVSFPEGSRAWLSRVGALAVRTARPASQAPATCWPAATCPPESPQAPLACGHRGRQAPEESGCGPLGRVWPRPPLSGTPWVPTRCVSSRSLPGTAGRPLTPRVTGPGPRPPPPPPDGGDAQKQAGTGPPSESRGAHVCMPVRAPSGFTQFLFQT